LDTIIDLDEYLRQPSDPLFAYKLLRRRKDGSLGPLFINKKQRIPVGVSLFAEDHPTPGYKHRPGWHCTLAMEAPHLSTKDRVWCRVEIKDYVLVCRPASQGGLWALANEMKVIEIL